MSKLSEKATAQFEVDVIDSPLHLHQQLAEGTLPDGRKFTVQQDAVNGTLYLSVTEGKNKWTNYELSLHQFVDGLIPIVKPKSQEGL